jgi:carbamate kinase
VIKTLLDQGALVICAGGGGIPTVYADRPAVAGRELHGVEAVIDKDLAGALLAIEIGADALAIVTDVDAVYADWGTPEQLAIRAATPDELAASEFAEGSMGPKVRPACWFVERTGGFAAIGAIGDTQGLLRGEAGTRVALDAVGSNTIRTG